MTKPQKAPIPARIEHLRRELSLILMLSWGCEAWEPPWIVRALARLERLQEVIERKV